MQMTMAELMCAYSVLEYKHKTLQTSKQKRQGNGKDKRGKRAKGGGEIQETFAKEECKYYCHAHGYQNSHNSGQCKVMANQPNNFSAERRRATDPNTPPGGSTVVRGKQQTVQASGLMVTNVDLDPFPLDESVPQQPHPTLLTPLPNNAPLLEPRVAWMLEGENCTDDQADTDWRRTSDSLFRPMVPPGVMAAAPPTRTSFFDEEYVAGRRVPSPVEMEGPPVPPQEQIKTLFDEYDSSRRASSSTEMEERAAPEVASSHGGPPEHIARLRDRIQHAMRQRRPMPDFPAARIPSVGFNSTVRAAMQDLVAQRDRWDNDLHLMVHDEAADGSPLEPNRDCEQEYQHASAQLNTCNRSLYTIYAQ